MTAPPRKALIIGAGPAGLTAAFELLERTEVMPLVLERSAFMGGIARTVNHHGNRIDLGGHRFFSKSDRVMEWWLRMLPLQALPASPRVALSYQRQSRHLAASGAGPDPEREDRVMLLRPRRSRIYYDRRFFDYPIGLSLDTLRKLGARRSVRIAASYLRSVAAPIREPRNLEEFFVNRFGRELYETFFESYTEKVWGVPCRAISAEWGAQRVKGLSVAKAIAHLLRNLLPGRRDLGQKGTETSLIEQFLYPKLGPGQMWETVAEEVRRRGGRILTGQEVRGLAIENGRVTAAEVVDLATGERRSETADLFVSTMPVQALVAGLGEAVPESLREIARGLVYRDFLTVGLLVDELRIRERDGSPPSDNWIYIQEPDVRVGRLQIFNNWSPYMVADRSKTWLGLEYFCNQGDELWSRPDAALEDLGARELDRIGILDRRRVRDATVLRMEKTYPAYFGSYDRFGELRAHLDRFENLFLLGRNGMHRYNNQDHSMLTAMTAVDNLVAGRTDKANLWSINLEEDYHEEKR